MQRRFQVGLKLAGLAAVMAIAAGVLYGCSESAKPMTAENQAKYKQMMESGSNGPAGPSKGGGGGGAAGANGPR